MFRLTQGRGTINILTLKYNMQIALGQNTFVYINRDTKCPPLIVVKYESIILRGPDYNFHCVFFKFRNPFPLHKVILIIEITAFCSKALMFRSSMSFLWGYQNQQGYHVFCSLLSLQQHHYLFYAVKMYVSNIDHCVREL